MSKTKKLIRRNLCLPLSIRNIQISCEKRFSFQNYSLKNKPFYYIHISLTILGNVNGVVTQLRNTILEIYFQFGVKYSLKNKVYPFKKTTVTIFAIAEPFVRNMNGGVLSIDINDLEISVLFQGQ